MTRSVVRMKIYLSSVAVLCFVTGHALPIQAKDLAVLEDRISSSPPDAEGFSKISGPPGSVIISPNVIGTVSIENTGNKEKISGKVNPDGSFSERIRASANDKLKITIMTSTDSKRKIKMKVPPQPLAPASQRTQAVAAQPGTERLSRFPDPTPEIIIRYKGTTAKTASGAPGRALNPDAEVLESGVLPPENSGSNP